MNGFFDKLHQLYVGPMAADCVANEVGMARSQLDAVNRDDVNEYFDSPYSEWVINRRAAVQQAHARHHRGQVMESQSPENQATITLRMLEQALYDEAGCVDPDDVPNLMLAICNRVADKHANNPWFNDFVKELEAQTSDEE